MWKYERIYSGERTLAEAEVDTDEVSENIFELGVIIDSRSSDMGTLTPG